jgi:hypothetical protein
MLKLLAIIGVFCATNCIGQSFDNIRVQKDEDKIIIVYDLVSIDPGSKVTVRVLSSLDDYKVPIRNATGDIGSVLPGPNKRIIWAVGEQIASDYQGILFRFEGQTFAGWKVISPTEKGMVRGKKNPIQWQGGFDGDDVIIQLLKPGSEEIQDLVQTKNTGSFIWSTPKDLKPGNGYVIRLTSGDNSVEYRFSIKRKIPLAYYGIPAAGLGIFLVVIKGNSGNDDLPDAPLPN